MWRGLFTIYWRQGMLKVTTQSSIGIDGGGDFFKICMYIMVKDEEEITAKKMKYSGGGLFQG